MFKKSSAKYYQENNGRLQKKPLKKKKKQKRNNLVRKVTKISQKTKKVSWLRIENKNYKMPKNA